MRKLVPLFFFYILTLPSFAQPEKVMNLPKYNHENFHFGFSLIMAQNTLIVDQGNPISNYVFLPAGGTPGFGISINSEYNTCEFFAIRFVPGFSFIERKLIYRTVNPASSPIITQTSEKSIIDLPLELKMRTPRFHNLDVYMLGGGRYSLDIGSDRNIRYNPIYPGSFVKLKKSGLSLEAALGTDVFLPFFKVSVDLKYIKGMTDLHTHQGNPSQSVDSIRSESLVLSLTFEG